MADGWFKWWNDRAQQRLEDSIKPNYLADSLAQRTELGLNAGAAARRAEHPVDKRDVADDALVSIANSLAALVILLEHDLETRQ